MSNEPTKVTDLKKFLQFGMKLSSVINFGPTNQYTFTGTFIGLKEHNYLIFELSTKATEDLVTRNINGSEIVLRGVTNTDEGHVIAFRSRILGVKMMGSSWLIFLSYPNKFETKPIRATKRYKVNIGAMVEICGQEYKAQLLDISVAGCGLLIKERIIVKPGEEVNVVPDLKNIPKPYPKAYVVNSRVQSDSTIVGVELVQDLEWSDELRLEILQLVV